MQKAEQLRSERTSGTTSPMMNTIIRDQIDERNPFFGKLTEASTSGGSSHTNTSIAKCSADTE